jgi:hypothetical protein
MAPHPALRNRDLSTVLKLHQLLFRLANNRDSASISARLRRKRIRRCAALLRGTSLAARILDVGGTAEFWVNQRDELPANVKITLLNVAFDEQPDLPGVSYITGDAREMEMFAHGEFDLCFSNSVIEHLGTMEEQLSMAREIRRVAQGYFVQTPNLYFPLEPHFLVFGWQFASVALRARLLQQRDFGWMKRVEDPQQARAVIESIRLLSARELRSLFPDGQIYRERVGPLTKSFVAWRPIQ